MSRTFVLLSVVIALAASGVTLYKHSRTEGFRGVLQSLKLGQSGSQVAANDLLAAARELERSYAANLTYTRADVSRLGGVELVSASRSAYCIQVKKAAKTYHLIGPRGTPASGACYAA